MTPKNGVVPGLMGSRIQRFQGPKVDGFVNGLFSEFEITANVCLFIIHEQVDIAMLSGTRKIYNQFLVVGFPGFCFGVIGGGPTEDFNKFFFKIL
jgi:hypothetical protein